MAHRSLSQTLKRQHEEWADFVGSNIGQDAELLYISVLTSNRRVYRVGHRIVKVERILESTPAHGQHIRKEFEVLEHISWNPHFNVNPVYERLGCWHILWTDQLPGVPLSDKWSALTIGQKITIAQSICRTAIMLHKAGVSHRDLRLPNFLIDSRGSIRLIDFGDARIGNPLLSLWQDMCRSIIGRHGIFMRTLKHVFLSCVPGSDAAYRRLKRRKMRVASISGSEEGLQLLEKAWRTTVEWRHNQNAWMSEYSLSIGENHYRGICPWEFNYAVTRTTTPVESRTFVCIGSNIGLLCAYLLLDGATECYGVELESHYLEADKLIARGLGVFPILTYSQHPKDWVAWLAEQNAHGDTLIVQGRVPTENVLRFLGTVPNFVHLLIEGHREPDKIRNALPALGYREISFAEPANRYIGTVISASSRYNPRSS